MKLKNIMLYTQKTPSVVTSEKKKQIKKAQKIFFDKKTGTVTTTNFILLF